MHSLRHVLSAAALAAVAATVLTACDKDDAAALQAALQAQRATTTTVTAPPPAVLTTTTTATTTTAPPTTTTTAPTPATTVTTPRRTYPFVPPGTTTRKPAPTTTAKAAPPADTSVAGQVLTLVNAERAQAGCGPVSLDARLTQAAAGHSKDMAANNYFAHDSQDGRSFVDRIRATGYPSPRSENIAAGQPTPAAVMDAWMNSPGHKRNILDCTATEMGLATAKGGSYGLYWTQDFGTA